MSEHLSDTSMSPENLLTPYIVVKSLELLKKENEIVTLLESPAYQRSMQTLMDAYLDPEKKQDIVFSDIVTRIM
jgi:hypothetical protein